MTMCRNYVKAGGGGKCKHFGPLGTCVLPWRFRCLEWLIRHPEETSVEEFFSHPEAKEVDRDMILTGRSGAEVCINPKSAPQAMEPGGLFDTFVFQKLSWSQIACFGRCPREWWLRYVKRIEPILGNHYFSVGKAGHVMAQSLMRGEEGYEQEMNEFLDDKVNDEPEKYLARLYGVRGVVQAWAEFAKLPDPVDVETEVHVYHPLLALHGYIDAVVGQVDGWELKFSASLEDSPSYHGQAAFYFAMHPTIERFIAQIFKKPNIRSWMPKKGESLDDLAARVKAAALREPDKWFASYPVHRDQADLLDLQAEMSSEIDRISDAKREIADYTKFPRRWSSCKLFGMKCGYLDICQSQRLDLNNFIVKPGQHRNR